MYNTATATNAAIETINDDPLILKILIWTLVAQR
jgi:hypothetical protein